jgi:hypothetical protein
MNLLLDDTTIKMNLDKVVEILAKHYGIKSPTSGKYVDDIAKEIIVEANIPADNSLPNCEVIPEEVTLNICELAGPQALICFKDRPIFNNRLNNYINYEAMLFNVMAPKSIKMNAAEHFYRDLLDADDNNKSLQLAFRTWKGKVKVKAKTINRLNVAQLHSYINENPLLYNKLIRYDDMLVSKDRNGKVNLKGNSYAYLIPIHTNSFRSGKIKYAPVSRIVTRVENNDRIYTYYERVDDKIIHYPELSTLLGGSTMINPELLKYSNGIILEKRFGTKEGSNHFTIDEMNSYLAYCKYQDPAEFTEKLYRNENYYFVNKVLNKKIMLLTDNIMKNGITLTKIQCGILIRNIYNLVHYYFAGVDVPWMLNNRVNII